MISIVYDKLEDTCKALKDFNNILSEYLDRSKRTLSDIYFTPLEMMECPKIHTLEGNMDKLQGQGKQTYQDIQKLISNIYNAIDELNAVDSKSTRDINESMGSSVLFLGSVGNKNISSNGSILSKSTSSSAGINSDNYSEGGDSYWDAAVGAKVTSGIVAASDREIGISVESVFGTHKKVSPNEINENLKDLGYNHVYRRPLLREIPVGVRDVEMDIPKNLKFAKGLGFLTLGLTALSVADDFKNNKTMNQKIEASTIDVVSTVAAYAASTIVIGLIDATAVVAVTAGIVATAPVTITVGVSIIAVAAIGVVANYAANNVKSEEHLW